MARIIIADDGYLERRYYSRLLGAAGHVTIPVGTATDAAVAAKRSHPDLVLIDICLTDADGITLYKHLRADPATATIPALLMTGLRVPRSVLDAASVGLASEHIFLKGTEEERLLSTISRLCAPIQQNLRTIPSRTSRYSSENRIKVDKIKRRVWVDGRELPHLAARRFDLLCILLDARGPVSRETVLDALWVDNENRNTVNVTIRRLRKDLRAIPAVRIVTTSDGYRLVVGD